MNCRKRKARLVMEQGELALIQFIPGGFYWTEEHPRVWLQRSSGDWRPSILFR